MSFLQKVHKGSWGLPDFGITEALTKKRTAQGGSNLFGTSSNAAEPQTFGSVLGTQIQSPIQSPVYGPQLPSGGIRPASGGQSGAPVAGDGGQQQTTLPQSNSDNDFVNSLRSTYGNLRNIVSSSLPGLEQDYTRVKGDIEGAIQRGRDTLNEQKEDINRGYGENLRNVLQSDREIGQKSRGVFSQLNALDSSAFADSEIKRQQNLFDTKNEFTRERDRSISSADRQYSEYESTANQQLADLGGQYMQGKQQLQYALANNDLQEATAIQNAMSQIQERAQNVQNTIANLKLSAANLQSQGVDVVGNLQKLNRSGIDGLFGQYLSQYANPTSSYLTLPNQAVQGQGYISPSEQERRRRMGMA